MNKHENPLQVLGNGKALWRIRAEFRGNLYFQAHTDETGQELYRLDAGSSTPTLIDINPGQESSYAFGSTEFRGNLYFNTYTEETGSELYRLEAGNDTPTLIDINPGEGSSYSYLFPYDFTELKGDLYFSAGTEETGHELYRLEAGSSTPTLIDINPGPESSYPSNFAFPPGFTEFEGDLYFSAYTEETGFELYRLEAGSSIPTLIEINPGPGSSDPYHLTEFKGDLYFGAGTEETEYDLYRLEAGSSTPTLIADVEPGQRYNRTSPDFTEFRGDLYFMGYAEETVYDLYRLEAGSSTPTLIDIEPGQGSSYPFGFTEFRGDLYFSASTELTGQELYRLEAGSSTPTLVADINPGWIYSSPGNFVEF